MVNILPQSQIYTVIPTLSPLHDLAQKYPYNMCWLASLYYALQFLGLEDTPNLRRKLSRFFGSSLDLIFISKDNGAMYFPKKYELDDSYIKSHLNDIFSQIGLKIKVTRVLSDITFKEIEAIRTELQKEKQLVSIVRNYNLLDQDHTVEGDVVNHTVLIKSLEDLENGRIRLGYIDPGDGKFHDDEVGINVFMQWIQYIWVLERKRNIFQRLLHL
jgi:hypothetical protein